MDAEIKRKWVEALRGGAYKQARGELFAADEEGVPIGNAYCCIGVGFCVARPAETITQCDTTAAARALGLDTDQEQALVDMNDSQQLPFPEIADYIEKNL